MKKHFWKIIISIVLMNIIIWVGVYQYNIRKDYKVVYDCSLLSNKSIPISSPQEIIHTEEFDTSASSTDALLSDLITHENKLLGISFQYPRQYGGNHCDIKLHDYGGQGISFSIGSHISLEVEPYSGTILDKKYIISSRLADLDVGIPKNLIVGGKKAFQIGYSIGDALGRHAEDTYVVYDHKLFIIGYYAGGWACGFEPMVYEKILETMKFSS